MGHSETQCAVALPPVCKAMERFAPHHPSTFMNPFVRRRAMRQSPLIHGKDPLTYFFDVDVVCSAATSEYVDMAKPSRQLANLLTQLNGVALIKSTKFTQLAMALG